MLWQAEWHALAARISGLLEAGRVFLESGQAEKDVYGISDEYLIKQALETLKAVEALAVPDFKLPNAGVEALRRYLSQVNKQIKDLPPKGTSGATALITSLAAFRSELEYLLSDHSAV